MFVQLLECIGAHSAVFTPALSFKHICLTGPARDLVCLPSVWSKQTLTANGVLQVLVYHDLLGMMQHPHHAKVTPKFCKQYAHVGTDIEQALVAYNQEVKQGQFPSAQFSPYSIPGRLTQPFPLGESVQYVCVLSVGCCTEDEVQRLKERLAEENMDAAVEGLDGFQRQLKLVQ